MKFDNNLITYLYVMKANARPTRLTELPRTTPNAINPPCEPHVVDVVVVLNDMLFTGGKP